MNKNAPYAPRTHELAYLANKMNMKLNEKQEDMLETISDFNMEARYGDYKYTFELKCTDAFDKQLNLKKLRRNIDYRIEPHLIEVADYDNVETPFIQEIIDTGIKVA